MNKDLYVFDAKGQGLHDIAQPGDESSPAPSPDGKTIVYESSVELRVMDADGSEARQLLSGIDGRQPDWTAE